MRQLIKLKEVLIFNFLQYIIIYEKDDVENQRSDKIV